MLEMIATLIPLAAAIGGFAVARNFVRRRLRFVDAVRSRWAPFVAGAIAAALVAPFTLLPLVGQSAAVLFGVGVGMGAASGVRALRRAEWAQRHLLP